MGFALRVPRDFRPVVDATQQDTIFDRHMETGAPMYVQHTKFGAGTVLSLKQDPDKKLEILFDTPEEGSPGIKPIKTIVLNPSYLTIKSGEELTVNAVSKDVASSQEQPKTGFAEGDFIITTVNKQTMVLQVLGFRDSPTGRIVDANGHGRIGKCSIPYDNRTVEVLGNVEELAKKLNTNIQPTIFCAQLSNTIFMHQLRETGEKFDVEAYLETQLISRGHNVKLDRTGSLVDVSDSPDSPIKKSNLKTRELHHGIQAEELERMRQDYADWLVHKNKPAPITVVQTATVGNGTSTTISPPKDVSRSEIEESIARGEARLAELDILLAEKAGEVDAKNLELETQAADLTSQLRRLTSVQVMHGVLVEEVGNLHRELENLRQQIEGTKVNRDAVDAKSSELAQKESDLVAREAALAVKEASNAKRDQALDKEAEQLERTRLELEALADKVRKLELELSQQITHKPEGASEIVSPVVVGSHVEDVSPVVDGNPAVSIVKGKIKTGKVGEPKNDYRPPANTPPASAPELGTTGTSKTAINGAGGSRNLDIQRPFVSTQQLTPQQKIEKFGVHGEAIGKFLGSKGWVMEPSQLKEVSDIIVARGLDSSLVQERVWFALKEGTPFSIIKLKLNS